MAEDKKMTPKEKADKANEALRRYENDHKDEKKLTRELRELKDK